VRSLRYPNSSEIRTGVAVLLAVLYVLGLISGECTVPALAVGAVVVR